MEKVKILIVIVSASLATRFGLAAEICNVCLHTPPETKQLHAGKGAGYGEQGHTTKLEKPLFSGSLFYSLDDSEKKPLPLLGGVFFQINDRKKHKIRILSESGKSWGIVPFDCSEYKYGTKMVFHQDSFYSPAWRTYPMPKNERKCPWHPENK